MMQVVYMSRMTQTDDIQMIRAARAGDRGACQALVDAYGQQLLTLIRGMIHHAAEAEEVLQDTLLKVFQGLDSYDPARASLPTWLSRIAYNTALNHLRLHPQVPTLPIDAPAVARHTIELADVSEAELDAAFSTGRPDRVESLTRALATLTDEERNLLYMRYAEERGVADIAYILGTEADALYSRLYRLRRKLYSLILNIENNEQHSFRPA